MIYIILGFLIGFLAASVINALMVYRIYKQCERGLEKDFEKYYGEIIKEFSDRLKESKVKPEFPWDDFFVTESTIDDLVKEMTEEKTK